MAFMPTIHAQLIEVVFNQDHPPRPQHWQFFPAVQADPMPRNPAAPDWFQLSDRDDEIFQTSLRSLQEITRLFNSKNASVENLVLLRIALTKFPRFYEELKKSSRACKIAIYFNQIAELRHLLAHQVYRIVYDYHERQTEHPIIAMFFGLSESFEKIRYDLLDYKKPTFVFDEHWTKHLKVSGEKASIVELTLAISQELELLTAYNDYDICLAIVCLIGGFYREAKQQTKNLHEFNDWIIDYANVKDTHGFCYSVQLLMEMNAEQKTVSDVGILPLLISASPAQYQFAFKMMNIVDILTLCHEIRNQVFHETDKETLSTILGRQGIKFEYQSVPEGLLLAFCHNIKQQYARLNQEINRLNEALVTKDQPDCKLSRL